MGYNYKKTDEEIASFVYMVLIIIFLGIGASVVASTASEECITEDKIDGIIQQKLVGVE